MDLIEHPYRADKVPLILRPTEYLGSALKLDIYDVQCQGLTPWSFSLLLSGS
jgi:hypothetical protein